MNNNFFVLVGFVILCLVNLPGKKSNHVATTTTPVVAPAAAPLPAPLKMNQANDVDLRPAVLHAAPSKLSDDN